jgi:hypothetical protein
MVTRLLTGFVNFAGETTMANKILDAHLDTLPKQIVSDPQSPPPGVIAIWGYLGKAPARTAVSTTDAPVPAAGNPGAATETYWRLYRTLLFDAYVEFRDLDVVHYEKVGTPTNNWTGTVVWLKQGSTVQYVQTQALELQRGFLQGDIAGSAAGQPGMLGGAGGSFLCNGAGGSFMCNGAGGSFMCNGAGGSFVCGPNMPGSFLCGGGGGSFLCGGAGGSFLCGGAGGSFVVC